MQHCPDRWGRRAAGPVDGGLRHGQALAELAETPGLVAHGGQDAAGEHGVPAVFRKAKRLDVVALGEGLVVGILGEPAGELSQFSE